ncbi:DUF1232 domain-containing protein [Nocardiopsis lucentensis]|uniref:DUF1232 domain-containing protein n=1 Tax=Nocardiopsis lucentensis TaxID=53441 RepID=UPI001F4CE8AE|nr:DUF1232 domain-containing protein [Nocardiopsis lucentensis]
MALSAVGGLLLLWPLAALARARQREVRLLPGHLALPVDPVPDFIPVLGHADDAIAVAAVLRLVGPPFAQDR